MTPKMPDRRSAQGRGMAELGIADALARMLVQEEDIDSYQPITHAQTRCSEIVATASTAEA
jgi:hypothetical protein